MKADIKVAVIGGGAAGFFTALSVKEHNPSAKITLFEKTTKVLTKVKISGGGRCNVTNAVTDLEILCGAYPRGGKQLRNSFFKFDTTDTQKWFESRGVSLKTEIDGKVFPVSNNSQSIIDCLINQAKKSEVVIEYNSAIKSLVKKNLQWLLHIQNKIQPQIFDYVVVASGGSPKRKGFEWLLNLGHSISTPVPSLFTFNMPHESITQMMGVTIEQAQIKIKGTSIETKGPLLITHWGMSGPAILKASALGARILNDLNYTFEIEINWVMERNTEVLFLKLQEFADQYPQKTLLKKKGFLLPNRLWQYLIKKSGIPLDKKWCELGKKKIRHLVELLSSDTYSVVGKTTFKEEFVTCGGIKLKNIDLKTMQSKSCPNLYFAGEVLDIDAITGGFNFQAAWTTGFIAGKLG